MCSPAVYLLHFHYMLDLSTCLNSLTSSQTLEYDNTSVLLECSGEIAKDIFLNEYVVPRFLLLIPRITQGIKHTKEALHLESEDLNLNGLCYPLAR